ncbi:MAG: hypothetical protein H2057_03210 [Alphaproteobacteria bacterium]|nr:hypothetical protein [Alphaproteobacteria bacterium]
MKKLFTLLLISLSVQSGAIAGSATINDTSGTGHKRTLHFVAVNGAAQSFEWTSPVENYHIQLPNGFFKSITLDDNSPCQHDDGRLADAPTAVSDNTNLIFEVSYVETTPGVSSLQCKIH